MVLASGDGETSAKELSRQLQPQLPRASREPQGGCSASTCPQRLPHDGVRGCAETVSVCRDATDALQLKVSPFRRLSVSPSDVTISFGEGRFAPW